MVLYMVVYLWYNNSKTNKMTTQELKQSIKEGTKFQTYYGNGEKCRIITVTRFTEKSIFWRDEKWNESTTDTRFSYPTIAGYITKGNWKCISK